MITGAGRHGGEKPDVPLCGRRYLGGNPAQETAEESREVPGAYTRPLKEETADHTTCGFLCHC